MTGLALANVGTFKLERGFGILRSYTITISRNPERREVLSTAQDSALREGLLNPFMGILT